MPLTPGHDTRRFADQTVRYDGWAKGMDNIRRDHDLEPDVLRNAVNVDVHDRGKLTRRKGYTELVAGYSHSLWTDGAVALLYHEGDLCHLAADLSVVPLVENVVDRPLSFTPAGADIYWSNGVQMGRLVSLVPTEWGVEDALAAPLLTATAGGMDAGRYQACVSFVTALGEESAPSMSALVDTTGGITLTLPQPTSVLVTHVRVYLTAPNGDVFYEVQNVPVGTTTLALTTPPPRGRALWHQHTRRFLPCDLLTHYRGRIYGASGNIVWFTEPFTYGLYRPQESYFLFPEPVTRLDAVEGGIYVTCGSTWWLGGVHEEFAPRVIAPYGAARGNATKLPDGKGLIWMSDNGLVLGSDDGQLTPLQAARIDTGKHAHAVTVVREERSLNQVLSVARSPIASSTLAASDWVEVEVIRAAGGV